MGASIAFASGGELKGSHQKTERRSDATGRAQPPFLFPRATICVTNLPVEYVSAAFSARLSGSESSGTNRGGSFDEAGVMSTLFAIE
jgi:hypothetical protein